MATANKIIKRALRLLQVKESSEPIAADEGQDALEVLNSLIDAWTNEDLMQHFREQHSIPFIAGQRVYTIGSGGDFNVSRTVSIENAFSRDAGGSDWDIQEINLDEYSKIILKSTASTYPYYFYYRPDFPLGEINVWPLPGSNVTFFINVRTQLSQFTDINTDINFPPGYIRALEWNLAVEIAPEYGKEASPLIMRQAADAKERIKDTNNKNVPVLESPLNWWLGYNSTLARFGGAGGGGGGEGCPIWTESGTAGITMTETGAETIVITELGDC